MQIKQHIEIMNKLSDFYGKNRLTEPQLEVWFEKLKHLDHEVAQEAASEVTSYLRNFPTPNEFLEKADIARSRVASRALMQDKRQAREFMATGGQRVGCPKDMSEFIFEVLSRPNNMETLRWKLKKYEELSEKYPPKNSWFIGINETLNQIFEMDRKQKEKELKRPKLKLVTEEAA